MTQAELRMEILRMADEDTIDEKIALLDTFTHCYMDLVLSNDAPGDHIEADAKLVLQMMLSKLLHIKKAFEGMTYVSKEGKVLLNGLLDPTIIAVLARNFFEAVCAFHLIYVHTKSKDERLILYNLWVIAGLQYRQKFNDIITTEENKQKSDNEKKQIDALTEGIKNTALFQSLDMKNQNKIFTKIKERDYKISFKGANIEFLSWQDVAQILMNKHKFFKEMYTYFSLYAHPSHVSVFQYSEMFNKTTEGYKGLSKFNLRFCLFLSSMFLGDYIKVFPATLKVFEANSDIDQIKMNFYNKAVRGDLYSINDSWQKLE